MRQMVDWYNNAPHSALRLFNPHYQLYAEEADPYLSMKQPKYVYLTPNQMQHDRDLEWQYIRAKKLELREIQQKQLMKGLLTYKPGNIIIIHSDYGKTKKKHKKRRRVFNELAEFICYEHGNVKCKVINPLDERYEIRTVPIMYTKYVSSSIETLNEDYKTFFQIEKHES